MVGGMGIVVGVMHDRARPHHEGCPELIGTFAGHANAVARLPGSARARERGRVEELEESHPLNGRRLRSLGSLGIGFLKHMFLAGLIVGFAVVKIQ